MSPETLAKTLQRLVMEARALSASAVELRHVAQTTRANIAEQVKQSVTRRVARLAQGGRDLDGDGDGSAPDGMLVETREPRCPHCQSVRIMRLEKMEVVGGRTRTDCECLVCEKVFVYSRKTLAQLAREELGKPHEQPPRDPMK
jgi:hypothetical protein